MPQYSLLLEQIYSLAGLDDSLLSLLENAPHPKGPVSVCASRKNVYLRDSLVSKRALTSADHRCEADERHLSFIRRNSPYPYMEPHHLVPMSETDRFNVSLDREQNIFSLCSNCHNQIHYGTKDDARKLLAKLFLSRKDEICAILGRQISIDEIFELYKL